MHPEVAEKRHMPASTVIIVFCRSDCSGGCFDTSHSYPLAGCAAGRSITFDRLAGKNSAHRL